jgi:hypothetical protein
LGHPVEDFKKRKAKYVDKLRSYWPGKKIMLIGDQQAAKKVLAVTHAG